MTHHHEPHNALSGQGPVVLDVGGDVGALVLVAGPEDLGAEIEISQVGGETRSHVAVLAHSSAAGRSTPPCARSWWRGTTGCAGRTGRRP